MKIYKMIPAAIGCFFVLLILFSISEDLTGVNHSIFYAPGLKTDRDSLDWGILNPGSFRTRTVKITNNFYTPITLEVFISKWTPGNASDFILVTWNYNGSIIKPRESYNLILALSVSLQIQNITDFTFQTNVIPKNI